MKLIREGRRVFDIEISALEKVRDSLNTDFVEIIDAIANCTGKIIITGMGKSGHIGRKISATMASLGTPSFFLHPAEALHGDLGMVSENDIVIAISHSGESEEIVNILSNIKTIGATIIGISGKKESTLIKYSDISQVFPEFREACYMGLAPTSSTTASLVYGDSLAIVASKIYGFDQENFGLYHPAGSLGKKIIIKVNDIMNKKAEDSFILKSNTLQSAINEIGKRGLGIVTVVDNAHTVKGVITDGDIRRQLENNVNIYELGVDEVMSKKPIMIKDGVMAAEALNILKRKNISSAPVVDTSNKLLGTIRLQDILNAGIVL